MKEDWKDELPSLILFGVIVLFIIVGFFACMGDIDSGGSGGSRNKATCSSCGRSYEAGDSGGNFMSIAKTSMCKNCYRNFQWANDALSDKHSRAHEYIGTALQPTAFCGFFKSWVYLEHVTRGSQ